MLPWYFKDEILVGKDYLNEGGSILIPCRRSIVNKHGEKI